MTVRFKKKVRKQRGYTSHGWGSKKKHRGGGSRGGRGFGGGQKHKFSYVTTKDPDHYGYKGFHSRKRRQSTLNVSDIDKMEGNVVDLKKLGYDKLLGKGKIGRAVTVTVGSFSAHAKEKIEKAGGRIEGKEKTDTKETVKEE